MIKKYKLILSSGFKNYNLPSNSFSFFKIVSNIKLLKQKLRFISISILSLASNVAFSQTTYYSAFSTLPSSHQTSTANTIVDIGSIGAFTNPDRVSDDPTTNYSDYANIIDIGSLLLGSNVNVQADLNLGYADISSNSINGGGVAGFVIDNGSAIDVTALGSITITTYLNNVPQESKTSNDLVSANVLNLISLFPNATSISFTTTKAFNSVGITVGKGVIGISAFTDLKFFYAYGTGTTSTAILPISLTSFTATSLGGTVKLGWSTATETNNTGFALERSVDGSTFDQIDFVASRSIGGNSSSAINYSTIDDYPLTGINYYRLKQIDLDGHFTYSNIQSVTASGVLATFKAFPNPATNLINVQATKPGTYLVELFSIDGRKVQSSQLSAAGGLLSFNINKNDISTGIYSLKVTNTDGKSSSFYNTVLIK